MPRISQSLGPPYLCHFNVQATQREIRMSVFSKVLTFTIRSHHYFPRRSNHTLLIPLPGKNLITCASLIWYKRYLFLLLEKRSLVTSQDSQRTSVSWFLLFPDTGSWIWTHRHHNKFCFSLAQSIPVYQTMYQPTYFVFCLPLLECRFYIVLVYFLPWA